MIRKANRNPLSSHKIALLLIDIGFSTFVLLSFSVFKQGHLPRSIQHLQDIY